MGNELVQGFLLGNAAILTNVCILPLYPGLIAFLAGNAANPQHQRGQSWLGLLVLAGVLSLMTVVGWLLFVLQTSFGAILPVLLPLLYGVVVVMGVLMLLGRNPFQQFGSAQAPTLRNPYLAAYLYGWLLLPLLIFWPFPLMVKEVWQSLGLPQIFSIPFMVFAILWVIIAIWKLADWHENRGRPFNPKNLSRKATEEKENSEK